MFLTVQCGILNRSSKRETVELGYLRLFPTEAVDASSMFIMIMMIMLKGSLSPHQAMLIMMKSMIKTVVLHIQDDDDDDHNPKRQLIPTSSQVKSGPIPSLYIQQRPPGGDRALPCFQTKFTLQSVLSFISHVTTGNKHHA